jgi:hypothetical protein
MIRAASTGGDGSAGLDATAYHSDVLVVSGSSHECDKEHTKCIGYRLPNDFRIADSARGGNHAEPATPASIRPFSLEVLQNPDFDPLGVGIYSNCIVILINANFPSLVFFHGSSLARYSIIYLERTERHSDRACLVVF